MSAEWFGGKETDAASAHEQSAPSLKHEPQSKQGPVDGQQSVKLFKQLLQPQVLLSGVKKASSSGSARRSSMRRDSAVSVQQQDVHFGQCFNND